MTRTHRQAVVELSLEAESHRASRYQLGSWSGADVQGGQREPLQDTVTDGYSHEPGQKRALRFRLEANGLAES